MKQAIYLIIFLLSIGICSAYQEIVVAGDTQTAYTVEIYEGDLDRCVEAVSTIDPIYFRGMKKFRISQRNRTVSSYFIGMRVAEYFWGTGVINIYDGCRKDLFVHELSHHKNYMDNISFQESKSHLKAFKASERDIQGTG